MAKIWPEIEISGQFLVAGHNLTYFGQKKIFFMIRTNFQASGHFESQNVCPFWAKIAYFGPKLPIFTKNFKFLKILRPEHGRSIFSYISEDICI